MQKPSYLINAANLQKGGGLQVAVSVLNEFSAHGGVRFHVLASPQLLAEGGRFLGANNFEITAIKTNPTASFAAWQRFQRTAKQIERQTGPDAVLTIFGPALWKPRAPHLMGFANGLYLFSGSRFIRQDWPVGTVARMQYAVRRRILLYRLRMEADAWWVETEAARTALAQAMQVPSAAVHIVANAVSAPFLEPTDKLDSPRQPGPYRVLVMGADYPNKNLALIPRILNILPAGTVEFLTTLPEDAFNRYFSSEAGVRNLGVLPTNSVLQAYLQADVVFAPSKLETFSAVYLEAMAARRPILASDLSFAHNVCGPAARYFDPWNPNSAAEAILGVCNDDALRRTLTEAGTVRLQQFPGASARAHHLLQLLTALHGPGESGKRGIS